MNTQLPNSVDCATLRDFGSGDLYAEKGSPCRGSHKVRQNTAFDDFGYFTANLKKISQISNSNSGYIYEKPDVFVRNKNFNNGEINTNISSDKVSSFTNFTSCKHEHIRNNVHYKRTDLEPFNYSKQWLERGNRQNNCFDRHDMNRVFSDPLLGDDSDENDMNEGRNEAFLYPWMRTQYGIVFIEIAPDFRMKFVLCLNSIACIHFNSKSANYHSSKLHFDFIVFLFVFFTYLFLFIYLFL